MTKTLSERISKIEKDAKLEIGHVQEATSAQINAHVRGKYRGQILYARYVLPLIQELQAENQALLAKNGELEAKVKELEGNGWLPIESAEIGKWVLVATAKIAMKAFVDTKANCGTDLIIIGDDGREYQDFVTHWMPLPELPTKIKGE